MSNSPGSKWKISEGNLNGRWSVFKCSPVVNEIDTKGGFKVQGRSSLCAWLPESGTALTGFKISRTSKERFHFLQAKDFQNVFKREIADILQQTEAGEDHSVY